MEYKPTIGLEVHAELKTATKMFCDCPNNPLEADPNVNICPVCLGHPGALPVPNKKAIEEVLKVGLALGGEVSAISKFDRKNYFYPDLPKGYQISQYDMPLITGGTLNNVRVRRIHLEEDTGRLLHELPTANSTLEKTFPTSPAVTKVMAGRHLPPPTSSSFVDFNRGGVPLMELVTEPDLKSAKETVDFARELQLILRYLGVSDADMEHGQMRIEANVSLNMGTYVELKNINSFRFVQEAIEYELARQEDLLEKGESVVKETRGWDENKKKTVAQRSKEDAHDYRYFPEPDIPPFETAPFELEDIKRHLPELPAAKRVRFGSEYKLNSTQVELMVSDAALSGYFEAAVSEFQVRCPEGDILLIFNYLTSDFRGLMNEFKVLVSGTKVNPEEFAHLVALVSEGKIMSRQAKDILRKMFETGEDPEVILKSEGLGVVSDSGELDQVVSQIIAENQTAAADYKKGKTASLQFLIGQAMGRLKGRGNPEVLKTLFIQNLGK